MPIAVHILNGPNTNLYGLDPTGPYGALSLSDIEAMCTRHASVLGVSLVFRQTNHEGALIDWIQEARATADALIVNGGSLSYTSIGVLDALLAFGKPVIEVHVSNIYRRESFRAHSFISKAATGMISGLGPRGYLLAMDAVAGDAERKAAA